MAKFFKFTLMGDDMDPDKIASLIEEPCDVYYKNTTKLKSIGGKERSFFQKTNRVVYSRSINNSKRIDGFLTQNLKTVCSIIKKVKPYLNSTKMVMEVVVYADKKAKITLNKKQALLLSQIGCSLDIVFL